MSKAGRELTVHFEKYEIDLIESLRQRMYEDLALQHFVDHEGMTFEEAEQRVLLADLDLLTEYSYCTNGKIYSEIVGARIDVFVEEPQVVPNKNEQSMSS